MTFGLEKHLTRTFEQKDLEKAEAEFEKANEEFEKAAEALVSFDLAKDYGDKTDEMMEELQNARTLKKEKQRAKEALEERIKQIKAFLDKNKKAAA